MSTVPSPSYRSLFETPGTLLFFIATCIGRTPPAMKGIAMVLLFQHLTGAYSLAGIVSATSTIAVALASPRLGRMLDRYGERPILIWSTVIHLLGLAVMLMAAYANANAPLAILGSVIIGASSVQFGSISRVRWSSVVKKGRALDKAYAMESMADELGFVVGPLIVVPLCVVVHPAAGLIVAVLMTVVAAGMVVSGSGTRESGHRGTTTDADMQPVPWKRPTIQLTMISYLMMGVLFGAVDIVLVAFAREHGNQSAASYLAASYAMGSLIGAAGYGAIHWRGAITPRMVIAFWWMGLGAIPQFLSPNIPIMAVAVFITGLAISPGLIAVNTLVERTTPHARLTETFAWMSSGLICGAALGAFATGIVLDQFGVRGGQSIAVICGTISALVMTAGWRVFQREESTIPTPESATVCDTQQQNEAR